MGGTAASAGAHRRHRTDRSRRLARLGSKAQAQEQAGSGSWALVGSVVDPPDAEKPSSSAVVESTAHAVGFGLDVTILVLVTCVARAMVKLKKAERESAWRFVDVGIEWASVGVGM